MVRRILHKPCYPKRRKIAKGAQVARSPPKNFSPNKQKKEKKKKKINRKRPSAFLHGETGQCSFLRIYFMYFASENKKRIKTTQINITNQHTPSFALHNAHVTHFSVNFLQNLEHNWRWKLLHNYTGSHNLAIYEVTLS